MPVKKLQEFLDGQHVKYVTITHSPAYTAQEIAACAHIRGKDLAKTVMVKADGKMAMAVVPASDKVSLDRLSGAIGVKKLALASEQDFKDRFPDCEIGAMPPFGNLYDMDVCVSESLAEDDEIAFNAGSHTELVKLSYKDFARLVHPKVASISTREAACLTAP
jgi:Ala-tRNA(Pro) deacylase